MRSIAPPAERCESTDCQTLPSEDPHIRGFEGRLVLPSHILKVVQRFVLYTVFGRVAANVEAMLWGIPALLLVGPPGVAKTSVIWACLNTAARSLGLQVKVLVLECAHVFDGELGRSAKQIDAFFARASSLASAGFRVACVLDDLEAIGLARARTAGTANPADVVHCVTTLLKCLDGLSNQPHVAVFATSNHPELLDPALYDRFGPVIQVPLPDLKSRSRILTQYLGGQESRINEDDPADLENVLHRTEGWSGRSLTARLVQTATLLSGKPPVELSCTDLNNALDILSGENK